MGKHLDPLEKEFLIKRFKSSPEMKINDFCDAVGVSNTAFNYKVKCSASYVCLKKLNVKSVVRK